METIILKIKELYIKKKRTLKWILFVGSLFFIFVFSAQPGNESKSLSKGLADSVQAVFESISDEKFIEATDEDGNQIMKQQKSGLMVDFVKLVRKSAHFILYFCLGILTFSLFREYQLSLGKCFIFTILFCSFYGATDEFHQLFVPGRLGKVFDVFIDSCGSICGATFTFLILKFKNYSKQKNLSFSHSISL